MEAGFNPLKHKKSMNFSTVGTEGVANSMVENLKKSPYMSETSLCMHAKSNVYKHLTIFVRLFHLGVLPQD